MITINSIDPILLTEAEFGAVLVHAGLLPPPGDNAPSNASGALQERGLVVERNGTFVASGALSAAVGPVVFGEPCIEIVTGIGSDSPRTAVLYARSSGEASIVEDHFDGSSRYTTCSHHNVSDRLATLFEGDPSAMTPSHRSWNDAAGGVDEQERDVLARGILVGTAANGVQRTATVLSYADGSYRWIQTDPSVVAEADSFADLTLLIENFLDSCVLPFK